ncbi:MAG: hypothetical protein RSF67_08430 [Clostridia bacterium]
MKAKLEIKKGNKFLWNKILYEIVSINELHFEIRKIDNGSIYKITEDEFYKNYLSNFIIPYKEDPDFYKIDLNSLDEEKKIKLLE